VPSPIKIFEAVCDQSELEWAGASQPVFSILTRYKLLLAAIQPFVDAANDIPNGTPTEDTVYSLFPPIALCVGDFYNLMATVKKG